MPTPSYIQGNSLIRGIENAQTGINIQSHSESFENPKEYILDRFGGRTGFAHDYDKSSTVTISGEVSTATDAVMSAAFGSAMTIGNEIDSYGVTTGDQLLDSIQVDQDRESFVTASLTLTRIDGLTVA